MFKFLCFWRHVEQLYENCDIKRCVVSVMVDTVNDSSRTNGGIVLEMEENPLTRCTQVHCH